MLIRRRLLHLDGNNQGFTLVELLVTVVILGLAIVSIGGLYYSLQIAQSQTEHLDIANRAASTEIENLRNSGYSSLVPGDTIDFSSSLPSSLPQGRTGTVTITEPQSGLRRVDVTISYKDFGKSEVVKLSSDIGIIGIGQGQ